MPTSYRITLVAGVCAALVALMLLNNHSETLSEKIIETSRSTQADAHNNLPSQDASASLIRKKVIHSTIAVIAKPAVDLLR